MTKLSLPKREHCRRSITHLRFHHFRAGLSILILSTSWFRHSSCSSAFAIPPPLHTTDLSAATATTTARRRTRHDSLLWRPANSRFIMTQHARALRAGGATTPELLPEEDPLARQHRLRHERRVSIALAAAYFSIMGAKCALPSVLSLLLSPTIGLTFHPSVAEPQQLFARQLTVATFAVALGKVLLGPVIDHLGGTLSLKITLLFLTVLMGTISFSQSFATFTCCWILVDFFFSSSWAACLNAIHQNFDKKRWGKQIGNLATAARAGNSLAFAAFAWVLSIFQGRMRQYWRPVFMTATIAQLIPLVMLSFFKKEGPLLSTTTSQKAITTATSTKPSMRTSLRILGQEGRKLDFWLHLTSRSALMLFASFLLFVPTFMSSVFDLSSAGGAQVGSLYALGCLLSVSTLSETYAKLERKTKCWTVALFLLVGATGSSFSILGHVLSWWRLSPTFCAMLFFLWGFSFSVPFYLPPAIYALSRGGDECSATIADAFDVGGFTLLAVMNGYVAGINHTRVASWAPTFAIMTACSLVSFLSLITATIREENTNSSINK